MHSAPAEKEVERGEGVPLNKGSCSLEAGAVHLPYTLYQCVICGAMSRTPRGNPGHPVDLEISGLR